MAAHFSPRRARKASAVACAITAALTGCVTNRQPPAEPVTPLALAPSARFDAPEIRESSGLAPSPSQPGIIWTHNDSGNPPVLYPVDRQGRLAREAGSSAPSGNPASGVPNVDWEDIAFNTEGQLIIADVGNNRSDRRELRLHIVEEPRSGASEPAKLLYTIGVYYPEQMEFPDPGGRFDCEAAFADGEYIYLITKNWSGADAWLYRVPGRPSKIVRPLERVDEFPFGAGVTAADLAPDGRLAVLTYNAVFVFTPPAGTRDWFRGEVLWRPIVKTGGGWQSEGLCWLDASTLLIASENGNLYEFPLRELRPFQPQIAGLAGSNHK